LSREAANQLNYYHVTLAPLFFEILNKPIETERINKYKNGIYKEIPYLNGGLFNNDTTDHYNFDITQEMSTSGLVEVPDLWLRKLFDLLERFNFTVDENTSYDVDLSIDPEMLGRVFENLLARINPETGEAVRKSTGSFYTPREIVEYMVDTSLSEYLFTNTGIEPEKINALISYDLFGDIENELNEKESTSVLEALSILTVLDPA
jgi:type I restriction-modification system DNA methylase subunit